LGNYRAQFERSREEKKKEEYELASLGNAVTFCAPTTLGFRLGREDAIASRLCQMQCWFPISNPERGNPRTHILHRSRVASEIAQEIGVLFELHYIDARASQEKDEHHPCRTFARNAALGFDGFKSEIASGMSYAHSATFW
jgi:hypothetical protein